MIPFKDLAVKRKIADGSIGQVYLGKWQETDVAVKVSEPACGTVVDLNCACLCSHNWQRCGWRPIWTSLSSQTAVDFFSPVSASNCLSTPVPRCCHAVALMLAAL